MVTVPTYPINDECGEVDVTNIKSMRTPIDLIEVLYRAVSPQLQLNAGFRLCIPLGCDTGVVLKGVAGGEALDAPACISSISAVMLRVTAFCHFSTRLTLELLPPLPTSR